MVARLQQASVNAGSWEERVYLWCGAAKRCQSGVGVRGEDDGVKLLGRASLRMNHRSAVAGRRLHLNHWRARAHVRQLCAA